MSVDRDQFEAGDEPIEVERRARAAVVVSIRLSAEEADRLQELAAQRNTTLSRLGREAIVQLLDGEAPRQSGLLGVMWTATSTFQNNLQLSPGKPERTVWTSGNEARDITDPAARRP